MAKDTVIYVPYQLLPIEPIKGLGRSKLDKYMTELDVKVGTFNVIEE